MATPHHPSGPHECRRVDVIHHVICRHQVEVEVWPARVPVFFRDERAVNPASTQARFEATVINSDQGVRWGVLSPGGGAGAGSIDSTGLYRAPPKGGLVHGTTDVVVATSRENPLRRAFAWVTLIGHGPAPVRPASIEISPRTAVLYYPSNHLTSHRNEFIDASNKRQVFQARVRDSLATQVEWLVDGVPQPTPAPSSVFRYEVTGSGTTSEVRVTARIAAQPSVSDTAKVVLQNYTWPKILPVSQL